MTVTLLYVLCCAHNEEASVSVQIQNKDFTVSASETFPLIFVVRERRGIHRDTGRGKLAPVK